MSDETPYVPTLFRDSSIGCVLDGSQGWHNTYRVVDLAVEYGLELDTYEATALEAYRVNDADDDQLSTVLDQGGLSERALEHLQARTAPGLTWVWDDGLYVLPDCLRDEEPLSRAECEHCLRGQFS